MRDIRKRSNIRHFHHGIGRRFGINKARVRADARAYGVRVADIHRVKRNAEIFPKLAYLTVGAAVNVVGNHNMVAAFEQRKHGKHGGKPCRKGKSGAAALQKRNGIFKIRARRVGTARIRIPYIRAEGRILKGRRLVDWKSDRAERVLRLFVAVNRLGGKRKFGEITGIDHGTADPFMKNCRTGTRFYVCMSVRMPSESAFTNSSHSSRVLYAEKLSRRVLSAIRSGSPKAASTRLSACFAEQAEPAET